MDMVTATAATEMKCRAMPNATRVSKSRMVVKAYLTKRAVAIMLIATLVLWLVLIKSAGNFYQSKRPEITLTFDGANHLALANLAKNSLLGQGQTLEYDLASRFALDAIQIAPRDSESLAVLGFAADAGRFETEGLPLLARAQDYSKRALLTQIYFIEHYVRQGDVQRALEYYDLALSTHPSSQRLLLPRLFSALAAPQVREQVIDRLRHDPAWKRAFWMGLTDLRPVPPEAIALLEDMHGDWRALLPGIAPRLVRALMSERRYEEGRKVATLLGEEARFVDGARTLSDFVYEESLPAIDWRYESSGSHSAVPVGRGLLLSARGSKNMIFASRVAKLPEGRTFAILGAVKSEFGSGKVGVSVRCAGRRDPLAVGEAILRDGGTATITVGPFTVPTSACSWQWLQISGQGASTRSSEFVFQDLEISRHGS